MAYTLGFLFADGNVIKTKRNTHFVALYIADEELLIRIRHVLGSNHKISSRASVTGSVYRLQIGSKELFDDVGILGLHPGKSNRMSLPHIPKIYFGDFVRGYFDGDGNVWAGTINRNRERSTQVLQVSFTSSSTSFLLELRKQLQDFGVRGGGLYTTKRGTYSRLSLSTLDALKLYKIMYNAPCDLFLERKKRIFERFKQSRQMRV